MKIHSEELKLQTKETTEFIDITDQVESIARNSGVKSGIVNVQSLHTTAAIVVNENEPLLLGDLKAKLEEIAPALNEYGHDNFCVRTVNMCQGECANGHAHCKHIFLGCQVALNLLEGRLRLGKWQRIFLVELDRSRPRTVSVMVMGE